MTVDERLRRIVEDQLAVAPEDITRDAQFMEDLGADSLDRVGIVMAVEEEFGFAISDDQAEALVTFGKLADFVTAAVARKKGSAA